MLASSVCCSLQCLISALMQGVRWWSLFFRLTCSLMLWGGRNTANCVHSDSATLDLPRSWCVCFPSLHWSDSRLLCWELSDAGPGLHALPRSKSLRFRFSGTPQRHRLVWTCILHPCQVQAAQVTRSLAHVVTLERCDLSPPLSQLLSFLGVSGVPCVSSVELTSDCNSPGRSQWSRIPGKLD